MKILHIITGLATGGAEMMLLRLLERVPPRQEIHVISLTTSGAIGARIEALGIPVTSLDCKPSISAVIALARLHAFIRQLKPDLVQTWMYHADLLGGVAAWLAGVRAIAWNIRNSDLAKDKTKRSTRMVVRLCAVLSRWIPLRIICCSVTARRIHEELGYAKDRFVVIPNGFDLSLFKPDASARTKIRMELGIGEDTPLVGLVARHDPQKNHLGFIGAAARVHSVRPDVHFLFAGAGMDGENAVIVREVEKAGIASVFHLLGLRNDMPHLMSSLDLLVSSSSYGEAFPNVLGEAMACGVPCVVTDVGDSAFIVGETGRVATVGDKTALAAAMAELLGLPAEARHRLAEQCRARVAAEYEIGRVVRHYHELYGRMAEMVSARNPVR